MWLSREEFKRGKLMVRTRKEQAKHQVEKKKKEISKEKARANWIREQERKIPAYSTGAQIKKLWEVHQPIGSEADWETDSSLEVEESNSKEVINLRK